MDLRGILFLGMHLRFRDPRRSHVVPKYSVRQYSTLKVRQVSATLEQALFVTLPVTFLDAGAFVMRLFAFGESDFEFDLAMFPEQGGGYQREAFALNLADQTVDFLAM